MAAASDIDRIFQLPLGEFTAARNTLAAALEAAGRAEHAAAVKAVAKPPLSAWTVNQLHWRHRQVLDQFMATGEEPRKAQTPQFAGRGTEMRALLDAHRAALGELTTRAAAVVQGAGQAPTPALTRHITTTLEALAAHGRRSTSPDA